jgi:uncharacterized protein (TIGR02391 family)
MNVQIENEQEARTILQQINNFVLLKSKNLRPDERPKMLYFRPRMSVKYPRKEPKVLAKPFLQIPSDPTYDVVIQHQRIREATKLLYENRHYPQAIFEACKVLEQMVKEKSGRRRKVGQALMAEVFNEESPLLKINSGKNDEDLDEQAGFKFIFMGVMRGIKDPKGHGRITNDDSMRTLQYLALCDLLAKRIDESIAMDHQ